MMNLMGLSQSVDKRSFKISGSFRRKTRNLTLPYNITYHNITWLSPTSPYFWKTGIWRDIRKMEIGCEGKLVEWSDYPEYD